MGREEEKSEQKEHLEKAKKEHGRLEVCQMGRQEHIQFHSTELPRPIKCSPSDQYTFPFSFWKRKQSCAD